VISKAPYFYNKSTGGSSWNHPRRDEYRSLISELREECKLGIDEVDILVEKYSVKVELKSEEETDDLSVSYNDVTLEKIDELIVKGSKNAYTGKLKTLLIIDPLDFALNHFKSDPMFKYVILDARKMHNDLHVKKNKIVDILEEARRLIVFCMLNGKTLVVQMGLFPVDFLNTFKDEAVENLPQNLKFERSMIGISLSYLPSDFLLESGEKIKTALWAEKLYRRIDLSTYYGKKVNVCDHSNSLYKVHDDFRVILTTSILKNQLSDILFNGSFGLPDSSNFEIVTLKS
jgi:hypothetical protein